LVATILAYILPSLCAVVINYRQGKYYKESFKAMLIFLIGLVVVVSGLISIFHKIINGYDCSHGKEMSYCSISHLNSVNYNSSISYSNYFTSFINHENSSTRGV
jgi:hypothetical protein